MENTAFIEVTRAISGLYLPSADVVDEADLRIEVEHFLSSVKPLVSCFQGAGNCMIDTEGNPELRLAGEELLKQYLALQYVATQRLSGHPQLRYISEVRESIKKLLETLRLACEAADASVVAYFDLVIPNES